MALGRWPLWYKSSRSCVRKAPPSLLSPPPHLSCLSQKTFQTPFKNLIPTTMTEYDYSPEAVDQYLKMQNRCQNWTVSNSRTQQCHPNTPPTEYGSPATNLESLPSMHSIATQRNWDQKKADAMRKMQQFQTASAASASLQPYHQSRAASREPSPAPVAQPVNQVYAYTQQTTPHGSQVNVNVTTQTADGRYIQQQQSYSQTNSRSRTTSRAGTPSRNASRAPSRAATPQTLEVPAINYAPLAHNPYPAAEHFSHSLPRPQDGGVDASQMPLVPNRRNRSQSSHGAQAAPGYLAAPQRSRVASHATSASRPPGAAAPKNPNNSAYANGLYALPVASGPPPGSVLFQQAPAAQAQPPMQPQLPSNTGTAFRLQPTAASALARTRAKSKSSATLSTQYRAATHEARHPRLEQMPPMPRPQRAQTGLDYHQQHQVVAAQMQAYNTYPPAGQSAAFYAAPRASKSSATLYAEPRDSSSKRSKGKKRHDHERPPMPAFDSSKMVASSSSRRAMQEQVDIVIPPPEYGQSQTRTKKSGLFARVFGKNRD
ncbi:hypothetical protein R3P38DRAFT_3183822 [Favolaschia claudopus]|uniref:Uncharacterized protein n=1 Tax=Favolaschia claudopus TaxID=2862362 RepID=A0AAW0CBM0_9AGAR